MERQRRRVYQSSASSLSLTLPSEWVKDQDLGPGDIVELELADDLIVTPPGAPGYRGVGAPVVGRGHRPVRDRRSKKNEPSSR